MEKGVDNKNLFTIENYKQKRRMRILKNINKNDILKYLYNAKKRISLRGIVEAGDFRNHHRPS